MVDQVATELARIASELGPAIAPAGHRELLTSILSGIRRLYRAEACSIALLSDDEAELVFDFAIGGAEDDIIGRRLPLGHGIAGWVALSGQPLAVADVDTDPRFASDFAAELGYLPRSILAVPIELVRQTERRVLGVIEVLDADPPQEIRDDSELLTLFANQIALALENAKVFGNLGAALFEAAGLAANGTELRSALDAIAANTERPGNDLTELASAFAELGRLGQTDRAAATKILRDFLDYVRASTP